MAIRVTEYGIDFHTYEITDVPLSFDGWGVAGYAELVHYFRGGQPLSLCANVARHHRSHFFAAYSDKPTQADCAQELCPTCERLALKGRA